MNFARGWPTTPTTPRDGRQGIQMQHIIHLALRRDRPVSVSMTCHEWKGKHQTPSHTMYTFSACHPRGNTLNIIIVLRNSITLSIILLIILTLVPYRTRTQDPARGSLQEEQATCDYDTTDCNITVPDV